MIVLELEFLAGQFHANPWERGTNEGEVEWPPSPWRLLRAITAGWYRAGAPDRENFAAILENLATPPQFYLPRAAAGHSRHYMPQGGANASTVLILDSFIALEPGRANIARAYVRYADAELSSEKLDLLRQSCDLISYLGRAESWCNVIVHAHDQSYDNLELVELESAASGNGALVRRLAVRTNLASPLGGAEILTALSESTAQMRKARRLVPRHTQWVEYRLPVGFLMVREQFNASARSQPAFGPLLLRFTVERGSHSANPAIEHSIIFGDLMRAAFLSQYSRRTGSPTTLQMAGKATDGSPRLGHDHPYFFPFDSNGKGIIDGIDIWFPVGCAHEEYLAATEITRLREHLFYEDGFPVTYMGTIAPPTATTWSTATPLILDRFPKMRGPQKSVLVNGALEQLSTMLQRSHPGQKVEIKVWQPGSGIPRRGGSSIRIDSFHRSRVRKHEQTPPILAATLVFSEPVSGPIAVGRFAHFGLGRFEPQSSGLPTV